MITIDEQIEVSSATETVWRVLSDPEEVMACVTGAEIGERHEDGSFDAKLAVKFGGLRVGFAARAQLVLEPAAVDGHQADPAVGREREPGEHQGRLTASGADRQGATRVNATASFTATPVPAGGTRLGITGEVKLNGKLASMIESGAGVVIARMTEEFSQALTARCGELERPAAGAAVPPPTRTEAASLPLLSVIASAFIGWLKGLRPRRPERSR